MKQPGKNTATMKYPGYSLTMPRATIIVVVDQPAEVEAVESWFARWADQISCQSENHGCGCCVEIWEVEATAQAIADLPQKYHASVG